MKLTACVAGFFPTESNAEAWTAACQGAMQSVRQRRKHKKPAARCGGFPS
jgi:hypothetical protein